MAKAISIQIPHPCSQNWDEMTPDAQGRHCAHCQKSVIDFTGWADASVYNFFAKNTGDVCGRFLGTQLNRPVKIPYQPHSRLYRVAVAMGFTLLFSQVPKAVAQTRPPQITQPMPSEKQNEPKGTGAIKGLILDEKGQPMPSAIVKVYQDGLLAGADVTDTVGQYLITPLPQGHYDLICTYTGYDSNMVTGIIVVNEPIMLDLHLMKIGIRSSHPTIVGALIVTWSNLINMDEPGKHTFSRSQINEMPIR